MIPILYAKYETAFASNGLGRLNDCLSCTVTEERNGIYECKFTYPISGEMYSEIQEGRIIGVIHDDAHDIQPFDIYARSAPLNGVVTFYAHHISYRLGNVILKPMVASSCVDALAAIPSHTYNNCPFTFWTDKSVSANFKNTIPSAVKAILGGQQGSILDVYGTGEYEWDKFAVKLYLSRGNDNGVSIRYGVNLTDLTHEIDTSSTYNAVAPYWQDEEGNAVTLTDGYVVTNVVGVLLAPWTTHDNDEITDHNLNIIEFGDAEITIVPMDLSDAFDEQPTEAQLRTEALRRLNNSEAWLPNENLTVKFIDLSHTEEYKAVAALQRVKLCDKVSVYCGPMGVSAVKMQVIRVVFNVLTERYDEIELGKAKTTFTETITAKVEEITKDMPTTSMMQAAINNATDHITGARNSHIRYIYDADGGLQEIVILDTTDIDTAVNVWRINSGGIGHSSNGYAGPYSLAMTMDGAIVADMITTGTLNANLIKAGVLDGTLVRAKLLNIVNENMDVIASFDDDITLGQANKARTLIEYNGLYLIDGLGRRTVSFSDLRDEDGYYYSIETVTVSAGARYTKVRYSAIVNKGITYTINGIEYYNDSFGRPDNHEVWLPQDVEITEETEITIKYYTSDAVTYFALGLRNTEYDPGQNAFICGNNNTATGKCSVAFGEDSIASGDYSLAEGYGAQSNGYCSYAEGYQTIVSYSYGHAEGYKTQVIGSYGHAEGNETKAGFQSHSEGLKTESVNTSHAEGLYSIANGSISHTEGDHTQATHRSQHVFGEYNVIDPSNNASSTRGTYVEIVGNGNSNSRHNARTLSWSGNEWIAGTLTQSSDSRLKNEIGEVPDLSTIKARRFRWNDKKGEHDDKDHIGYFAQDVEKVAPYLVDEDAMGYKSLDYIGLLVAKIDALEKRVAELERGNV